MEPIFRPGFFLLPQAENLPGWPVIACDQFTSDRAFWARAEETAGQISALRLILPEVYLEDGDVKERVERIHAEMDRLVQPGMLRELGEGFVYTERQVERGVRHGLVGLVDLERYDMDAARLPVVRPSEKTVPERIPPRKRVRQGAALDLSHVLLLMDDEEDILGRIRTEDMPCLYDMDLPMGGGHIRGWLIQGAAMEEILKALRAYEARKLSANTPLVYAVGDGNHSLATARACYEEAVKSGAPEAERERLRYACVELNSVREPSMAFEPIHRLLMQSDPEEFLKDLQASELGSAGSGGRSVLRVVRDGAWREIPLSVPEGALLARVQIFLDEWLKTHPGKLDYIHGLDSLEALSRQGNMGLQMPGISREGFFASLQLSGVFPRKTFSIGHALEKRYYMEVRRLKP